MVKNKFENRDAKEKKRKYSLFFLCRTTSA